MTLIEFYNSNREKYLDTDKELPNHKYISRCYTALFEEFIEKNINILEIGVASGGR